MSLEFITKERRNRTADDVTVDVYNCTQGKTFAIIFRNSIAKHFISEGITHIEFAIDDSNNRLYFKASKNGYGWKLSRTATTMSTKCINSKLIEWCEAHKKNFEINYDPTYRLYYIEDNGLNWIDQKFSN